jgi:hypothetical protein
MNTLGEPLRALPILEPGSVQHLKTANRCSVGIALKFQLISIRRRHPDVIRELRRVDSCLLAAAASAVLDRIVRRADRSR